MTKEYISRDEMIEQTKARIVIGAPRYNDGIRTAIEVATSIPTADVVEVVRCRECYFRELDGADVPVCTGAMAYSYTSDDWFCADGKPKDGGNKMKNEYIIRDEAMTLPVLPKEQRIQLENVDEAFEEGWRQALENLAILPAADVVEVVRGKWEIKKDLRRGTAFCNQCNYAYSMGAPFHEYPPKYCPSCGAKMDGGPNE